MKSFIKKGFASLLGSILFVPAFAGITGGNLTGSTAACPTITVTLTQTNEKCYGETMGLAVATASGGVSPYTYSWTSGSTSDSAKNLAAGSYTVTATDNNGCTGTATVTITQPAQIRDSISRQTNETCYGNTNGSLRDGVKGGTGTYTYVWSPSGGSGRTANGLSAGTYTVVVTDANGCMDSTTGTITQPNQIKDSTVITNVACKGGKTGSITSVSTTGGTSPYTYAWSTGATTSSVTGLGAGTYTLTVRDKNLCTQSYTLTVTQPATALTLTASQLAAATCGQSNGSAYATVTGGNMPYDFTWSPAGGTNDTAKGLAAGSYSVIVTDSNGCSITASTSVADNSTLASTVSSTGVTPCFGGNNGTVTVTTTGGTSPYSYSWSTGATTSSVGSLSAGIYSVTVTDASGCITTNNDTVKQPAQLKDSISAFTDPKCNGSNNGSATSLTTGGTSPYTYMWSDGQTTSTATNLAAGTYTVTTTDANGCTASNTVTLTQPSAIKDSATAITNVSCYGGTNGSIRIGVSGGSGTYTYSWAPGGSTRNRVTGGAGTYTVTITDANGCTKIDSFTITQPASALAASITDSTMVACFGSKTGSAVVTATGGTPGYTYTWAASGGTKDTAMNIGAGTYTVNVRDANACTTTATVVITQPASAVTATDKTYAASCGKNNGAAVVTASGGTPGYTYTWSPSGGTADSAAGIGQGIYTCLITDSKGCTYTVSANVADSSTLALAIVSQTNVSPCFGDANGTATVRASGGTPGYTYTWSPYGGTDTSATGLAGGTYTVTVKDTKGCAVSDTIIITRPALLVANITSSTNPTCNGGTGRATVAASGGTPGYTYSWAPGGITSATANGIAASTYTVTVTDKNGCTAVDSVTITQPPAITDSLTSTNITCFGSNNGSATVSASGGTPGYTYTWTPGGKTTPTVNNLTAGTYTVTIRDANFCTATATVTITEPAQLRDSLVSSTNIMCFGDNNGSATIGVKGGTPNYTYSWTPGGNTSATANTLTAGNYTVTITDANGCIGTTVNVTITQPASAIADSSTTVDASCGNSNGSASVYVYGGTPGYTYSWNTGSTVSSISNVAAGAYTCNITDANGCSSSQVVIVNDNSTLAASITAHAPATCNGSCDGSATAGATGGTGPYTYSWTPGGQTTATITGLCAGKYTFTATDSKGCISSDTVTIAQPPMLTIVIDSSITGGCTNSVWAVVNGGTPPYTYSWTPGGQTTDTASSLCNGTYTVTVTDANSCSANSNIVVAAPTGIASIQNGTTSVKLYPVPTTGMLNVSISGNDFTVQSVMVYDLTGRELVDQKVNGAYNLFTVDLSSLEQGSYILKLVGKNNTEKVERFTVVK